MSMYNLDSDGEDSDVPSNQSPTVVLPNAPLLMHMEVHSSPITEKGLPERHYVIEEEDHPSSYNIKEIFGALTFNFHRKKVSWKIVWKVKKSDGTLEEMQEDEVLFKKNDEDPVTVAIASTTLSQDTAHNITVLNDNLLEIE